VVLTVQSPLMTSRPRSSITVVGLAFVTSVPLSQRATFMCSVRASGRATWSSAIAARARRARSSFSRISDVVEAKREDWSFDPFTLTEKEETLARAQVTECPLCDLHPRLSTLRDPNIP